MVQFLKNSNLLEDGAVFKNLRVIPESLVLTGDGHIVTHNWRGLLKIMLTYKKIKLPADSLFLVVHTAYRGYYHWLLEALPKLLVIQSKTSDFVLLVPEYFKQQSFYAETLTMLGVTRIEYLYPNILYSVPKLVIVTETDPLGTFTPSTIQRLQSRIRQSTEAIVAQLAPKKFLYISRMRAVRRKIVNEAEVEAVLKTLGFTIICLEDYSFQEQVTICSQASAIVGIHGAGLANCIFLPPGSFILELRKEGDVLNYMFERLAAASNIEYLLQYCPAVNPDLSVQDADIEVDVVMLQSTLVKKLSASAGG